MQRRQCNLNSMWKMPGYVVTLNLKKNIEKIFSKEVLELILLV